MTRYDVIVIGSGGGLKIALPAAAKGLNVALIEQDAMGGTCLNRGCIPSKMLIWPTEIPAMLARAAKVDVQTATPPMIDFPALVERVTRTVDGISATMRERLRNTDNLTVYSSHARFVSDRRLEVGDNVLEADKIFIATGLRPAAPDVPGLPDTPYMTSRDALRRTDPPRKMIVIGAGYIAVELGGVYAAAGTAVDFIVRSRYLRQEDDEISAEFAKHFTLPNQTHAGFHPAQVRYRDGEFAVTCRNGEGQTRIVTGDALLAATGVVPESDTLGLENTGIETAEDGHIRVDDHLRTAVPGVYALGDVVGNYLYRHTVNYEGEYLVRTAIEESSDGPIDYGPVPHAVFSQPEIAGVGATEQELREAGADYVVGRADHADSNMGMARGLEHGFVKILVDRAGGRLLGAHIIGDEASDMIHVFIMAMKKQATLDDLLDMIFIHPALPEVARDAARDARRRLTNTP